MAKRNTERDAQIVGMLQGRGDSCGGRKAIRY
jgi:hypothetical protein